MGVARLQISGRLLGQLLHLPRPHRVTGAKASNGGYPILVIEGPDLPDPNPDGSFKFVTPTTRIEVLACGTSVITGFEAVD